MFRTLYSKLAGVILALFIVTGILFFVVFFPAVDMYHQEVSQKLNRELAQSIVKENLLLKNSKINDEALKHVFHMMMVINPSIELYLLDPGGKIMTYSAAPGKVKLTTVDLSPVHKWLSKKSSLPLLGQDPRNPGKRKVFSAARIKRENTLEGYLYIILGGEDFESIAQRIQHSYILKVSGWAMFAGFVITFILGLLTFFLLTRRLRRLSLGIGAFQAGKDLSAIELPRQHDKKTKGDEIDQLADTFMKMAIRIEEQVELLEQTDHMRRELIANVSHDLRTPLATLTAYVETLQIKADSLSEEEVRKNLEVTKKQCKRLNSLVHDLFELSRLDAAEITPALEPFNIAELVQDIVLNYQLPAKRKQISLTAHSDKMYHQVVADIRLVERALENLLGNALRHTPVGGSVAVKLSSSGRSVKIRVLDTGVGIEKELLPHIFDRYQSSRQNTKSSERFSGLGLAIAKKIIELHGSALDVESEVNSGSSFSFSLPIHHSA